jgi:hypothetical protein
VKYWMNISTPTMKPKMTGPEFFISSPRRTRSGGPHLCSS